MLSVTIAVRLHRQTRGHDDIIVIVAVEDDVIMSRMND